MMGGILISCGIGFILGNVGFVNNEYDSIRNDARFGVKLGLVLFGIGAIITVIELTYLLK